MHEGGWEPFEHHFSSVLEGVVPQDEETRRSGEGDANKGGVRPGKVGPRWRDPTEK